MFQQLTALQYPTAVPRQYAVEALRRYRGVGGGGGGAADPNPHSTINLTGSWNGTGLREATPPPKGADTARAGGRESARGGSITPSNHSPMHQPMAAPTVRMSFARHQTAAPAPATATQPQPQSEVALAPRQAFS